MNGITYFDVNNLEDIYNKKIIIYGAGRYGTFLLSYLKIKDLSSNVLCFAVSKEEENIYSIWGKPIKLFEDIHIDFNETVIIIAVNKKNISAILENLKDKNIKNCYWFSQDSAKEAGEEIFKVYQKFPVQKNKVFFYCYEGMGYRCNCKYIAEKLLKESYPVKLVWAVSTEENSQDIPKSIKTVKIGTEEYYRELYTSLVIIENDGKDPFACKRQGQFCVNTWHGYGPFKKVNGALSGNDKKSMKEYYSYYDLFITASKFYSQVYRDSFGYDGEIMECGAPRNDIFFMNEAIKEKIYNLYNIPLEKGTILFAPTFRYDKAAAFDKYDINIEQILDAVKKRFHKDYVLMYRFHHQLYNSDKILNYYAGGIDVTLYPDIQELLITADMVITDYSSLMWDFSLQKKPVFLYQKDLEEYKEGRGFYSPVSEWPYPRACSQEELVWNIEHFENERYTQKLDFFLRKFGSCDDGHASERVVKRIIDKIEDN